MFKVGGGNSTHCLAPLVCSAGRNYVCQILTRQPSKWNDTIEVVNEDLGWLPSPSIKGIPSIITSDPAKVIPTSDIILFAGVPIHHNPSLLRLIKPHLSPARHAFIGSICCYGGFNWVVRRELGVGNYSVFGTNLIPWCCGTKEYGKTGVVFGAKRLLRVVTEEGKDRLGLKEKLYPILRQPLADTNFLASTLWPNNASLHPPILYGLFKDWDGTTPLKMADLPTFIYKELSESSAEAVCQMDRELVSIVTALSERFPQSTFLKHDFSMKSCILENYAEQVLDKSTTSTCVASNLAFAQHKIPYTDMGNGMVVPTIKHKFFETDLPFGLVTFLDLAMMCGLATPLIVDMILWNQKLIGKEFIVKTDKGIEYGKDKGECVIPSLYGLTIETVGG